MAAAFEIAAGASTGDGENSVYEAAPPAIMPAASLPPAAEAGHAARATAPEGCPLPPYKEGDDPTKPEGLACNHDACTFIGRTWGGLLRHHGKHGWTYASLKGTYLYKMGSAELNRKQNERYHKKRMENKKSKPTDSPGRGKAPSKRQATSQNKEEHPEEREGAASKVGRAHICAELSKEKQEDEEGEENDEEENEEDECEVEEQEEEGNSQKSAYSLAGSAESSQQELPRKRQKERIPEEKRMIYEQFTLPKDEHAPRRLKVDETTHAFMQGLLKVWQEDNGAEPHALPKSSEWYLDARVECIKGGFLSKFHSSDVVRSYLKHYIYEDKRKHRGPAATTSSATQS
jgi:hypothetical protein